MNFVDKTLDTLAVRFLDVECNIKGLIEVGKEAAEIKDKINKQISDKLLDETFEMEIDRSKH